MGFSVTCKELPILMKQLREVDRNLANEMKRGIRKAELPAKRAMQQAALSAPNGPMEKAAGAVKTNNRFTGKTARLTLRIDSGKAPNARPLDRGSQGSGGNYDRHPVFGYHHARRFGRQRIAGKRPNKVLYRDKTVWVKQPLHKFFDRGAKEGFKECEKGMQEALDAVVRALAG